MQCSPDIALFTRWVWGGGAERVMANLASGFAAQGLAVDLIVIQSHGVIIDKFHKNVRIIDLDIQPASGKGLIPSSLQSIKALPKLIHYLKAYQPAVLLSATHYINEIALLAKRLAAVQTRVVVTEHTFLSKEVKLTEQVSSRLVPLAVKALYFLADDIIAVSHGVAEDLRHFLLLPGKPIKVIYNPVITPEMHRLAKQPINHPWFYSKDRPIIIGGGRFVRQKDFPNLLKAFAKLRERHCARLILLGDGRERAMLEKLALKLGIYNDLWMPGYVDNSYAYLAKADIFALSSEWEGLPTILIEALALGVAVVSTDCPSGPAEILKQGAYGHLVPIGDPDALASALAATLEGDCRKVSSAWLEQFTLDTVIRNYVDVVGLSRLSLESTPTQENTL